MAYQCVVCVKQVPDTANITGEAMKADGTVNRAALPTIFKPDQIQTIARQRLRRCVVTVSTPAPELLNVTSGIRVYDSFPSVELTPKGVQHDMPGAGGGK